MIVAGTRPEAIKLSPVIHAMQEDNALEPIVCTTGQHADILKQAFEVFRIKPDHDLALMKKNQDLFDITSRVLVGMRTVFSRIPCDMVLVQGDTTTAFATALAAFYAQIPVAHLEAGLRTSDKSNPFPEEINRRLAGTLADIHFAPTSLSQKALLAENVLEQQIMVTGNTIVDALLWVRDQMQRNCFPDVELLKEEITQKANDKPIILVTAHRRESFGQPFIEICEAIRSIALIHPDVHIVYPVHPNPNVQNPVHEQLANIPNVHLIKPVSYPAFVWLMDRAYLILTDSGGVQEEAPSLNKPLLIMRETTERTEGIAAGTSCLVGRDAQKIVSTVTSYLTDSTLYNQATRIENPYGDGKASIRVCNGILYFFGSCR